MKNCMLFSVLLMAFLPAVLLGQTVNVQAGVAGADLVDALAYVNGGGAADTLLLVTDGGIYELSTGDTISVPLTIMAAAGLTDKPIIRASVGHTCESFFKVWADLTMEGVIFDGKRTDGTMNPFLSKYMIAVVPHPDGTFPRHDITFRDCEFRNVYKNGLPETDIDGNIFSTYTDAFLGNLVIEETTLSNVVDEAIIMQNAAKTANGDGRAADTVIVRNCTFINCGGGPNNQSSIMVKGDDDITTVDPKMILENLTFYNSAPKSIYCREIENVEVRNIIIANTGSGPNDFLIRVQRDGTVVSHIDTFGIGPLLGDPFAIGPGQNTGAGMATLDTATIYGFDPMFADPENGDFTLSASSPAVGAGEGGATLGDKRWWPAGPVENVIQIAAGTDQIATALAGAQAGDIIELTTSGGVYNETATTVIGVPVTIRAAAGLAEKPVWTCNNGSRNITLSADLTLEGIILDGALGAPTKDCIRIDESVSGQDLRINNCVIQNFTDGTDGHAIKGSTGTRMDSVIVKNTLFAHMPGEPISFKDESADIPPASVKYMWVENCTFWDGMNEAIYFQAHDAVSAGTPDPECYIIHVTVVSMGSKALYPNQIDGAVIKNSIVINSSTSEYACRLYGTNSSVQGFLYWNCPQGINLQEGATDAQLSLVQAEVDPMMADVANGDFTLAASSPAVGAGVDGATLGDPRWWPTGTAVEGNNETLVLTGFQLKQNYPNPFNPTTSIKFVLDKKSAVKLQVSDIMGSVVATLVDGEEIAGSHQVTWDGSNMASGVYFYRLITEGKTATKKMMLIK